MKRNLRGRWLKKAMLTALLTHLSLICYLLPALQGGVGGGSLYAQDVSVTVNPVQQVLPPRPDSMWTTRVSSLVCAW